MPPGQYPPVGQGLHSRPVPYWPSVGQSFVKNIRTSLEVDPPPGSRLEIVSLTYPVVFTLGVVSVNDAVPDNNGEGDKGVEVWRIAS